MNLSLTSTHIVYILCAVTALACAVLLLRGYLRTKARLLFWAGLCFALLSINNIMVFVDVVSMPELDLSVWRTAPAMLAVILLIYGLIWEDSQGD